MIKKGRLHVFLAMVVFIALLAVLLQAAGLLLQDQTDSAQADLDEFFRSLRNERPYDAYDECAARLKEVSFEGFEQSVETHGLDQARDIQWTTRKVGGTEATFAGAMDLAEGNRDEVTVKLVRERGKWRVYSIVSERAGNMIAESRSVRLNSDSTGTEDAPGKPELPSDDELQQLVNQALMRLNEAIQIEYFGPFYQSASTALQQQTSPTVLLNAFQVFIEKDISFAALRDAKAVFTQSPSIDDYGILQTDGYYLDKETRVNFRMKFILERGEWKLFGIGVNLVKQ